MSGFGLIELIVAVVLLGILFLMALQGTALIDTMRALVTTQQLGQYQAAVLRYQGEFRGLPGDDRAAPRRFARDKAVFVINGFPSDKTGDGQIDGRLSDYVNANGEQFMAWRDLRAAGMVEGDRALSGFSAMPENPFGGVYGFDQGNLGQPPPGSLCATRVPGRAAAMIDDRLDDGRIDTGKLVATSRFSIADFNHFDAPDSAPYDFEKEYIICVPILP